MVETTELARLIVVRAAPDLPWCVVDPQRWGAAGAPGKADLVHAFRLDRGQTGFTSLRYTLYEHVVILMAYHVAYTGSSCRAELRLDDRTALPLGCWEMTDRHRRLFASHPGLRIPFRNNDRCRDYPLVRLRGQYTPDGDGLLLVERTGLPLRPMGYKEQVLFCHARGIS